MLRKMLSTVYVRLSLFIVVGLMVVSVPATARADGSLSVRPRSRYLLPAFAPHPVLRLPQLQVL